jgi:chromosome partitioning protein
MLGRRKGRNRSGTDVRSEPETAATPPPPAEAQSIQDSPEPLAHPGIEDTISEVATAHAELDIVLPPERPREVEAARDAFAPTSAYDSVEFESVESAQEEAPSTPSPLFDQAELDPLPSPEVPLAAAVAETVASVGPPTGTISTPEVGGDVTSHREVEERAEPAEKAPAIAEAARLDGPEPQSASGNPLPRVLAVANQKGGVGKTTTSVNLGAALAELGFRVLVIDLDPQGNATTGLGIDARNFELSMYDVLMRDSSLEDCVEPTSMKNLFVAPATIALAGAEIELVPAFSRELKLKRAIESVIDDFDYVLIDCPPSLGLITVNALAAADEVLVPIQCEYYALEGLSQLMRNVHLVASNLNPKLDISTIVLTMYDARTKLSDQVASEVRLHFGSRVCRNVIPRTVRLSEAPSFGQPITAFDPASRGAIAYRELAKEVSGGAS